MLHLNINHIEDTYHIYIHMYTSDKHITEMLMQNNHIWMHIKHLAHLETSLDKTGHKDVFFCGTIGSS